LKVGGRGGALGWTDKRLRGLLVLAEIALAVVARLSINIDKWL
jgi:hypothetical protein